MTDSQKPTNWWTTLPGLLTAFAGLVTAVTALLALLFQHQILGASDSASRQNKPASSVAGEKVAVNTAAETKTTIQAPVTGKTLSDSVAIVTTKDGVTTSLRASSFSNCISVNHELTLHSGQSIPFESMAGFEVLQADAYTAPNARAKLNITLPNGKQVIGDVDANCDLFGTNDLGRFSTFFDRIKSVRFER